MLHSRVIVLEEEATACFMVVGAVVGWCFMVILVQYFLPELQATRAMLHLDDSH